MAKVPGIWRAKSKVSEAELQADRRRTEARLAAIFGLKFESLESLEPDAPFEDGADGTDGTDGTDDEAWSALETASPEPEPEMMVEPESAEGSVARPRPGIIVVGSRDLVPVMVAVEAAPWTAGPLEDWDEVAPMAATASEDEVPAAEVAPADTAPEPAGPVAPSRAPASPRKARPKSAAEPVKPKPEPAAVPAEAKAKAKAATPAKAKAATAVPAKAKAAAVTAKAKAEPGAVPAKAKATPPAKAVAAPAKAVAAPAKAATFVAWCPTCAIPLEPAPTSSRRCAQCRQRIIVKRIEGRTVFLAEAVLPVFEAERRRVANASRLARECQRWLRLAAIAGAPAERVEARALAAVARPSEEAVTASRILYIGTVERAYQQARRERRWEDASRIRRDHALVLHRDAGSPVPPSEAVLKLHRDAMAASLRGVAEIIRDAELVAGTCCDACRADDRRIVRISAELRVPSLPHEACPKGLCGCRWDLPTRHRATLLRQARRRANTAPRGPRDQAAPAT
jgi:hypothetical protein